VTPVKVCNICKKILPADADHFYRHAKTKDGFRGDCIRCHSARAKSKPTPRKNWTPLADDGWRLVMIESEPSGESLKLYIQGAIMRFERTASVGPGTSSHSTYAAVFDTTGKRYKTLGEAEKAAANA
jgi:hypothetical protein